MRSHYDYDEKSFDEKMDSKGSYYEDEKDTDSYCQEKGRDYLIKVERDFGGQQ